MERAEKTIRRFVPENDTNYVQEMTREIQSNSGGFGKSVLDIYESGLRQVKRDQELLERYAADPEYAQKYHDRIRQETEETEKRIRERFLWLAHVLEESTSLVRQTDIVFIRDELGAILFDNDEITAELQSHFGKDLKDLTIQNLVAKIRENALSLPFLLSIAKKRYEHFSAQSKVFESYVSVWKEDFKQQVQSAVHIGVLPESVLTNLNRIDAVKIQFKDLFEQTPCVLGEMSKDTNRIEVNSVHFRNETLQRLRSTIFHELLHSIDGISVVGETLAPYNENFRHKKTGVQIKARGHARNRWINEGVTEKIALLLSGYADDKSEKAYAGSTAYTKERRLLDQLIAEGLDEKLVYHAYFENFTTDQTEGERGKYFGELVREINRIRGPYAFNRLENEDMAAVVQNKLGGNNFYTLTDKTAADLGWDDRSKFFTVHFTVGKNPKAQAHFNRTYAVKCTEDNAQELSKMTVDDWHGRIKNEIGQALFFDWYLMERLDFQITERA